MKEHPILFSPRMIRAILDGRKTQTRRVITPQPPADIDNANDHQIMSQVDGDNRTWTNPYGVPGDRLWVRETFVLESTREYDADEERLQKLKSDGRPIKTVPADHEFPEYFLIPHYKATDPDPDLVRDDEDLDDWKGTRWTPSIHMPRWASRILLDVVDTRVERLHDISVDDCKAEGVGDGLNEIGWRYAFGQLWNSINEDRGFGWDVNPWVWVVEFKRIQA